MKKYNFVKFLVITFLAMLNVVGATTFANIPAQTKIEVTRKYYSQQIQKLYGLQSMASAKKTRSNGGAFKQKSPYNGKSLANFEQQYIFFAVDSHGNLYLPNLRYGGVEKYSAHGDRISTLGLPIPLGLFVDKEDNVYVYDGLSAALQKFDSYGNQTESIGLRHPDDVFGMPAFNLPTKLAMNTNQEIIALMVPVAEMLNAYEEEFYPDLQVKIARFNRHGDFLNNVVSYNMSTESDKDGMEVPSGSDALDFGILTDNTVVAERLEQFGFYNIQSTLEFYAPQGAKLQRDTLPISYIPIIH